LQGRAVVIEAVDGTRERNEVWAEIFPALAEPDLVLDLPKLFVDRLQLRVQGLDLGRLGDRVRANGDEQSQLRPHVAEFGRVASPFCLDLQDRELVEQFAGSNLYFDRRQRTAPGELGAQCVGDPLEELIPVAVSPLAELTDRGIPRIVLSVEQPAPVRNE